MCKEAPVMVGRDGSESLGSKEVRYPSDVCSW